MYDIKKQQVARAKVNEAKNNIPETQHGETPSLNIHVPTAPTTKDPNPGSDVFGAGAGASATIDGARQDFKDEGLKKLFGTYVRKLDIISTIGDVMGQVRVANEVGQGSEVATQLVAAHGGEIVLVGAATYGLAAIGGWIDGPLPYADSVFVGGATYYVLNEVAGNVIRNRILDFDNPNKFGSLLRDEDTGKWFKKVGDYDKGAVGGIYGGYIHESKEEITDPKMVETLNQIHAFKTSKATQATLNGETYVSYAQGEDAASFRINKDGTVTAFTQDGIFEQQGSGKNAKVFQIVKTELGYEKVPVTENASGEKALDWKHSELIPTIEVENDFKVRHYHQRQRPTRYARRCD